MRKTVFVFALACLIGCSDRRKDDVAVPLDQLPEPVTKVAKEKLPDVTFEHAWKTRDGNYEVRGKTKSGKVRDLQVSPSGEVVEVD